MVSIGQTFVILTGRGGIDLSVASVMATVAVIIAYITGGQNSLFWPAISVCLPFGLLIGLVDGLLITKRKVPPFMATLGVMIILQGCRFLFTKGALKGDLPPYLRILGTGNLGPIPISIISLAVMTLIGTFVLKKTVLWPTSICDRGKHQNGLLVRLQHGLDDHCNLHAFRPHCRYRRPIPFGMDWNNRQLGW